MAKTTAIAEVTRIKGSTGFVSGGKRAVFGRATAVAANGQILSITMDTGDVVKWRGTASLVAEIVQAW